jgi:Phosphoesterase family/DDE superfamily endonuclease
MVRHRETCKRMVIAICVSVVAAPLGAAERPAAGDINQIQHVVFIIKENRSFDNYFGTFAGADGATSGRISLGVNVALSHTPNSIPNDLGHGWFDALAAVDRGKMDGFDLVNGGNINGQMLAMTQLHQEDIPNYFAYAQNFVLADRMFSAMPTASFPNHLYAVANDSGGVFLNPMPRKSLWGCDAASTSTVPVVNSMGLVSAVFPCFSFPTLADRLQSAGITWKYYAPSAGENGYIYSTLDAFSQIRNTTLWTTNIAPYSQFATDAMAGNLPAEYLACSKPKELGYAAELWTRSLLAQHVRREAVQAGHPSLSRAAKATVQRILAEQPLHPERVRYYLEKRDPDFEARMRDVLLVYQEVALQNGARGGGERPSVITVSIDEKPGLQAIANTAPDRPPVPRKHPYVGRDHEYKRLGTCSILAALDLHEGHVTARVEHRHRSREFIALLRDLDQYYPADCTIRIILDNHSAHISKETQG